MIQVIESMVSWVVSLEAPTTEMASLQVFVDQHRHTGIQKQQRRPVSSTQRTTEKDVSKIGVDFGPEGGVDLAWSFWGREKRHEKIRRFRDKIRDKICDKICDKIIFCYSCQFPVNFGTGFVPQNQKSTASSHPTFAF